MATDSSLPGSASAERAWRRRALVRAAAGLVALLVLLAIVPVARAADAQLKELRVEQTVDGFFLYAQLDFELSTSLQSALENGIPIYFITEARILRKRWYWRDKRLSDARRYARVAYQPLARQWRLNTSSRRIAEDGLGAGLTRYYDSLEDVLGAIKQIAGWKIADLAALSGGGDAFLHFSFRLDSERLPRTFLLGDLGANDWRIAITRNIDLTRDGLP